MDMNTNVNTNTHSSSHGAPDTSAADELQERFLLAYRRGEALRDWMARYPEHARDLAELALAVDRQRVLPEPPAADVAMARSALRRALETVEVPQEVVAPVAHAAQQVQRAEAVQPVRLLGRAKELQLTLPQLARRLGLTTDLLAKLDQGYIRLETVPRSFLAHIAQALQTSADAVAAGLQPGPRLSGNVAFYTKDRPQAQQPQSFAEALQQAHTLPAAERARWLQAAREEGLAQ